MHVKLWNSFFGVVHLFGPGWGQLCAHAWRGAEDLWRDSERKSKLPSESCEVVEVHKKLCFYLWCWCIYNYNAHTIYYIYKYITLSIFFLMYTVDGRNPVPPGMYKTLSMMWTSTSELVQYQQYNHENIPMNKKTLDSWRFFYFLLWMKSGLRDWIGMWNSSLFFQRIWYQDSSGARSRGDGWFITIRGIWNRWFDKFVSVTVSLTVFLASSKKKHLHIWAFAHLFAASFSYSKLITEGRWP